MSCQLMYHVVTKENVILRYVKKENASNLFIGLGSEENIWVIL